MKSTKLVMGALYKTPSGAFYPLVPGLWWDAASKSNRYPLEPVADIMPSGARPDIGVVTHGIARSFGLGPIMGSDPEMFLSKDSKRVAAFSVLPDKHGAFKAQNNNPLLGKQWFWDGFQAETQISPQGCHTSFAALWQQQLVKLQKAGLEVHPGAVWRVPDEELERAGETEVGLGCSPSYNAYGMTGRMVENPRRLKWRFAGGHIHFEQNMTQLEAAGVSVPYVVKALDCFLGVPSVAMFQNYDSPIRRRYYGLAGEFRIPKHGIEYRSLSNGWLLHPQSFQIVLDLARHAYNLGRTRLRRIWVGPEEAVRDCINYNDVRQAQNLMKLNKPFYDAWLENRFNGPGKVAFWNAIGGGFEAALKGFGEDVYGAWGLGGTPHAATYAQRSIWAQLR